MRRFAGIFITVICLVGTGAWLGSGGGAEVHVGPAEVPETTTPEPLKAPPVRRERDPAAELAGAIEERENRRHDRLNRKQTQALERLEFLVARGEVTEEEAQALRKIAGRTFARAHALVDRRESGELGPIGVFVRAIPLRITHVTQVVDTLGRDRAREVGAAWRAADPESGVNGVRSRK